ncbi:alpha/beta hydrolase family protein [Actinomadura meridiana]|uniref:Alpha/beta hydrolase family protein n=1 Tax=Actinomadura meridiana TaxID=559626 RepID=A0ABP8CT56_9ACTN
MPPPQTTSSPCTRRRRRVLACAASIAVVLLTSAGTGHADPYAPPVDVPALTPSTLDVRYAAERRSIEDALTTARAVGDSGRTRTLGAFLRPGRRFLYFDPRGRGRAVEVIGDLARAHRVAVLVPGADTTVTAFDTRGDKPWSTPGGGARALYTQAQNNTQDLAVVAWLGYAAPETFSDDVLTDDRAGKGAVRLHHFLDEIHKVNPSAHVGLLCHSYGSVVCGRAAIDGPMGAAWRQVTDIALFGSPGAAAPSAKAMSYTTRIWAGRGTSDWMEDVPHVRLLGLGLGPDPVSAPFGARLFDAGEAGHSDYLEPGSTSLRNLAAIAIGHPTSVTRG